MQIGHGKRGVVIGEYADWSRGEHWTTALGKGDADLVPSEDTNPVMGYIEPACDNPQWILWFMADGSAILHQNRDEGGAITDDPLKIKARRD